MSLPGDYAAFVSQVADGGPGPKGGVLPLDRSGLDDELGDGAASRLEPAGHYGEPFKYTGWWNRDDADDWSDAYLSPARTAGTLILAHDGSTWLTLLVLDGECRGQIWEDARGVDVRSQS